MFLGESKENIGKKRVTINTIMGNMPKILNPVK